MITVITGYCTSVLVTSSETFLEQTEKRNVNIHTVKTKIPVTYKRTSFQQLQNVRKQTWKTAGFLVFPGSCAILSLSAWLEAQWGKRGLGRCVVEL